ALLELARGRVRRACHLFRAVRRAILHVVDRALPFVARRAHHLLRFLADAIGCASHFLAGICSSWIGHCPTPPSVAWSPENAIPMPRYRRALRAARRSRLASESLPQLGFCAFEQPFAARRQIAARAIDVEVQHRHGGL